MFDPCIAKLRPSEELTRSELQSVREAVELWNRLAELKLHFDASPSEDAIEVRFQSAAGAFKGLYDDQRGVVFINSQLQNSHDRIVTITHELGHAFGLSHVSARARMSLMNPGNVSVEPTPEDVAALRGLWGFCPDASE